MRIPRLNHTQVPNIIVDNIMKNLSGSELKVLLIVCRKTIGWQKIDDDISQTQFMEIGGLSRNGAKSAIKSLLNKQLIRAKLSAGGNPHDISNFEINYDSQKMTVSEIDTLPGQKLTETGSKNDRVTRSKNDPTKESINKDINKVKETKHIHGEYSHVRLKEKEFDTLKKEFPEDIDLIIKTLDEAKEMKGYKYLH